MYDVHSIPIHARAQQLLQIVVENQGRVCYGPTMKDFKGIVSNVTINGKIITDWKMNGIPLSDGTQLTMVLEEKTEIEEKKLQRYLDQTRGSMSFWMGSFETDCNEEAR
jgi:beta-galactosidase